MPTAVLFVRNLESQGDVERFVAALKAELEAVIQQEKRIRIR
jgi:hypothetical protein